MVETLRLRARRREVSGLANFAKTAYTAAMTTMNVSLPKTLKQFVDERVSDGGYGSSSEYIRELIREDQVRQAKQRLAEMIRAGLESGEGTPVTRKYWRAKRDRILKRSSGKS